jgi:hypothetical protein
LAYILNSQGKYAEAEAEQRALLSIRERVLGPEHSSTLISLHNIAVTLKSQEKLDEAGEFARRAMEGRRKVLGPMHPFTKKSVELYEELTSQK